MNSTPVSARWRRMIALMHLEAFAAAVEQLDNPLLRGRPVGVVNSEQGSVLVAASAEARAAGVEIGSRWPAAGERCPALARVVARPARYAELSARLMQALTEVCPELEVVAPGQAFLDLTRCQAYYRHDPARIGTLIQTTVQRTSGLSCAVGISGDRTTAAWAARQAGPGGLLVIPPADAEACLAPRPLAEVCGVGPGITEFLAAYGVQVCGDMKKIPSSVPARRFGSLGRRLWLMAQGRDPAPVDSRPARIRPYSHGKILAPDSRDALLLQACYADLAGKLAGRLHRDGLVARDFLVSLRAPEGWREAWLTATQPTNDAGAIALLCRRFLRQHWFGEPVRQLRVHGGSPQPAGTQVDFFAALSDNARTTAAGG